nr:glycosyltransferase [uncultured Terrisporobacter sp.]
MKSRIKDWIKYNINNLRIISKIKKDIDKYIPYIRYYSCKKIKDNSYNSKYSYEFLKSKRYFDEMKSYEIKEKIQNERQDELDLSIIIPAYNVENYICDCIDSVIRQKTKYSYEIIIINDGSKDNTLKNINLYSNYKNVTIISQENAGISRARNLGISLSKGHFLMFLDSDDVLVGNSISTLLNIAYKYSADIVEGNYKEFIHIEDVYNLKRDKTKLEFNEYKKNPEYILNTKGFAWGKIYSDKLWENVRFPEDLEFEDTIVKYILHRMCNKYICISDYVYGYRSNPNSITQRLKSGYAGLDSLYIIIYINKMIKKLDIENDETLYELTLYQLGRYLYYRTSHFDDELCKHVLVICREIIINMKCCRPKKMSFWLNKLEKSIMNIDINRWKICSKSM